MAGSVEELILRIIGDSASGEQALDRIDQKLKPLKSRFDQIAAAGRALGLVFGGLAAAGGKLIQSTARVAMRNEVLALSLYTVGENAGYSRQEMDVLTDRVKALGITTSQARLSLTRMIQGQLNLAKATDLARTAQDLAVVAGENSSQTYEGLSEAITSLQPRLLRKYGIVTTLNQALGDLADSTDVAAKRNRMLEFVLAEGARVAGVYEEAMGVVGKRITSIPRLVEEAQAAFGKHFLPIIGQGVDMLSKLLKAFQNLPEGVQRVIAMAVLLGTGFSAVAAAVAGLAAALPFVISGFSAVSGAISPLLPALAPVAAVIAALVAAGALLSRAWKEDWGGIRAAVEEAWQKIGPILRFLGAYLGGWAREISAQLKSVGSTLWTLLRGVFEPVFSRIAQVIKGIDWLSIYRTLRDALNVAGNTVKAFLETLRRLLRGEGFAAFSSLESAALLSLPWYSTNTSRRR
jgi:phage-related protein